jgi:uncharacterized protein
MIAKYLKFFELKPKQLVFLFLFLSWGASAQNPDFEVWKINREKELLAEDGWLNLAGLFWITETNSFLNRHGKDSLILSNQASKQTIGTFQLVNDSIWFFFNPKVTKRNKIQRPGFQLQYPEKSYGSGAVYYERWKWTVITRGGDYAMRLRDLKHPALSKFQPLPYFDYDSAYSVDALFIPKFNQTIAIPNVLGQVIEWKIMGLLQFDIGGEKLELTALDENGKLFVIFSDLTNESDTYPTGRYMYVNYPDQKGKTRIDFNFAYNPPCAFTPFATCPIPPKVNRLEAAIRAGEKHE